jgi:hypothetical protein
LANLAFIFPRGDDHSIAGEDFPLVDELVRARLDVFGDVFRRAAERGGGGRRGHDDVLLHQKSKQG